MLTTFINNAAEKESWLALMCRIAHVMTGGMSAVKLTHPQWRAGRGEGGSRDILLLQ